MKKKILRSLSSLAMMVLATACSSEVYLDTGSSPYTTGEEVEVTFSVNTETAQSIVRAVGDAQSISKGSHIDMLVYAVYDADGTLLLQYGKGLDIKESDKKDVGEAFVVNDANPHKGQTVAYVGDVFPNGTKDITLRLMRGETYHVAFWAQSSHTDAYDTNDLENVKVSYENAKNNDEHRDAFCKVETFYVAELSEKESRTVTLRRPLAQVNIGTTVDDFKNLVNSPVADYGGEGQSGTDGEASTNSEDYFTLVYSKIVLEGAATKFNVVTNTVSTDPDDLITASFELNKIPAYVNSDIPSWEGLKTVGKDEELLKIDLNGDKKITSYDETPAEGEKPESYKYLSMCYVLVPDHVTMVPDYDNGDGQKESNAYGTTLNNIQFYMSIKQDTKDEDCELVYTVKGDIPVQRNWRTNLLGEWLLTQGVLYRDVDYTLNICPDYIGDKNNSYSGTTQNPDSQGGSE